MSFIIIFGKLSSLARVQDQDVHASERERFPDSPPRDGPHPVLHAVPAPGEPVQIGRECGVPRGHRRHGSAERRNDVM